MPQLSAEHSATPPRILIGEGEPQLAQRLQALLTKAGFAPVVVKDGEEAWNAVRQNRPEVALMEVVLPKALGTEVCTQMKKHRDYAGIPVILMSGGLTELKGIAIENADYRADDYLFKPFNAELLVEKIRAQIQKQLAKAEAFDVDQILTMPAETPRLTFKTPEVRFDARAPLNITVDYRSKELFFSSPIMNISKGGIFVRSEHPLPIGKIIDLTFTLPDQQEPLRGKGRVVWVERATSSRAPGMGIRFKDFQEDDLVTIYGYVKRLKELVR